jgi:hypothetical protein
MAQNGRIGLLLIIFGLLLYFLLIPQFVEQYAGIHGAKSGRYFPYVLSFLTVLCGSIMLAFDLVEKKVAGKAPKAAPGLDLFSIQSAAGIVVLSLVYVFMISRVGYLLSTMIVLPVAMWMFGYRKVKTIVIVSVVSPLVIYLIFVKMMAVPLPVGTLFQ